MVSLFHDFDLDQYTPWPTHNKEHTLDVFITQRTTYVSVHADPPLISDHSLITGQISINTVNTTSSEQVIYWIDTRHSVQ